MPMTAFHDVPSSLLRPQQLPGEHVYTNGPSWIPAAQLGPHGTKGIWLLLEEKELEGQEKKEERRPRGPELREGGLCNRTF